MESRLLVIGLGIEADDKGIFEWKPLTLKMKIFPADNVNIEARLDELLSVGIIANYEIDGRKYGAIRNFRKFQRPKTPNDIHPITDDFRKYVGLTDPISEPFPPKGEKSPQMEDVGCRREVPLDKSNGQTFVSPPDPDKAFWELATGYLGPSKRSVIGKWVKDYGRGETARAIAAAQVERAVDPVPYVERCLRGAANGASQFGQLSVPC